ncbi:MAG: YigZ family protein [Candidatus Coproplasma sp.]
MAESFNSVEGKLVTEKVIEKSRFITTSAHVESEEEAKEFIEGLRKKYSDATHNCYAFIADAQGNFMRFTDDGEPQGTAGMPMLEVIKNNGLRQIAVVVTRYFGGIKLGAGGLVRAYSGCVAENLASAQRVCYQPCTESLYTVEYPFADQIMRYFSENDCSVSDTEYAERVSFKVAVKSVKEEEFNSALINKLCGNVKIEKQREYMFPFKVGKE